MMKKLILMLALLCSSLSAFSQEQTFIYKGTVDARAVTVFLKYSDGCGTDNYYGMYKYDGVSKWLLLDIAHNDKKQFCMTENNFSGVLMITQKGDTFEGIWYSPDRKKMLPVKLKKATTTDLQTKEMQDKYETINYEANDC